MASRTATQQHEKPGAIALEENPAKLVLRLKKTPGFVDVPADHWVRKNGALDFAFGRDIMRAAGDVFDPAGHVLREDAVLMLFNAFSGVEPKDSSTVANQSGFVDVADYMPYTQAINWAKEQHVVNGHKDSETGEMVFDTGGEINCEQFAAMLRSVLLYVWGRTKPGIKLADFEDAHEVSGWAAQSVRFAAAAGALGREGMLTPKKPVTRAVAAHMVMCTMLFVDPQCSYTNIIPILSQLNSELAGYYPSTGITSFYKAADLPAECESASLEECGTIHAEDFATGNSLEDKLLRVSDHLAVTSARVVYKTENGRFNRALECTVDDKTVEPLCVFVPIDYYTSRTHVGEHDRALVVLQ